MKCRWLLALILLIIIPVVSACSTETIYGIIGQPLVTNTEESKKSSEVKDDMRREFCVVVQLMDDQFVLRNTVDELYYIDNSYLGEFKEGDNVLLLYNNRVPLNDGYAADVYAIYPSPNELVHPAN